MDKLPIRRALGLAFTASGFSALAYQVAWQRALTQSIGSDAVSVVLVVTIFMACLGLGSELSRRFLRRSRANLAVTYATIEVAVGAYGLVSIPILRVVNAWSAGLGGDSIVFDTVINLAVLAPPVIGMGMTTPLIVQLAKRSLDDLGQVVGSFYGLNILGAAVGALMTGLVLIETVGLQGTTVIAGGINIAIGLGLGWLLRGSGAPVTEGGAGSTGRISWPVALAAVAFGFGTLAIQISLFRILANYFTMATVVFPVVLCVYLLLMAAGQLVGGRLADRYPTKLPNVAAWLFAAGAALLLMVLRFPPAWAASIGALNFTTFNGALIYGTHPQLIGDPNPIAVFVFSSFLLLAVVPWAALFPVMLRHVTRRVEDAGQQFAWLYSLYTVGNVAGAFLCGLVIMPGVGTGLSIAVTIVLVAAGVVLMAVAGARRAVLAPAGFGLICAALMPADYYKQFRLGAYAVDGVYEGRNGVATTVPTSQFYKIVDMNRTASASAIVRDPGPNDLYQAWRWNHTELLALDPTFRPKSALIIGIGHAYLIDALLDLPFMEKITIVDISDEVVSAVRDATQTSTKRVFSDPRVEIVIADGRRYVQKALANGRRFDLIQTKINEPWHAGSGNLFTVEFLRLQRALLSPGGYLGVRPLAGHVRDGLEVFDAAVYPGFYHVYFKNGELPEMAEARITPDIREAWFAELPGRPLRSVREPSLPVAIFRDKAVFASIAHNTDDHPTFEYYWLRQKLGLWTSPRTQVSAPEFERFRRLVQVRGGES